MPDSKSQCYATCAATAILAMTLAFGWGLANSLRQHWSQRLQVGLAGPSGSGKTVFSEKVQHFLPGEADLCYCLHHTETIFCV